MKMNRKSLRVFALILALMPSVAFAQSFKNKTLMTLGNNEITAGEFMQVYEKNNFNSDVIDKKDVADYLDLYVNFKLKVIEAESLGMDTTKNFKKEFDSYRKQLAKPYFTNDEASEELVAEAYQRMQKDVNASHILIKCESHASPNDTLKAYKKAMDIRKRILAGEDFGVVAAEVSDDPSARDMAEIPGQQRARKGNHGNLGYFTVFDMVYPFESGAYNTNVGEISMPVRSDFGYHLIKVNSITPASGSIIAAHIFLIVDEKDPNRQDSVVKAKIDNIYKEINPDGSNWDVMVSKYTDDKGTIGHSGILSTFKVSNIVPEFITVVKSLNPNEISEPIKTNYGYHIIKLISTKVPGDFDSEKTKLKERVDKDMRARVSEDKVYKRILKENKFKECVKIKDAFINTIDSTLTRGSYQAAAGTDSTKVLFSIDNHKYTVGDFIDYMVSKQSKQPFLSPASVAYQMYEEYVRKEVFAYEDNNLEKKYPEFNLLVQEYHDGMLLFDLMEQQVWKKAVQDTTGLNTYYENNKGSYTWGPRVKAMVMNVSRPNFLEEARALIKQDLSNDEMREIIKNDSIRYVTVKTNFYQKGDDLYVDSTNWVVGSIIEFPSTVDKSTKIIKVLEAREPENKSFKEAKGLVTSDYQTELEKQWIEDLKAKYPVVIDEKLLEKVKKYYTKTR